MGDVKVLEQLDASADAVWGFFQDFGGVKRYRPALERCVVEGEGIGALRTLVFPGGMEVRERLERRDHAGRSFSYSIVRPPAPLKSCLATVVVRPDGDASEVEWSCLFEADGVPEEQVEDMLGDLYRGGIEGIRSALGESSTSLNRR